MNTNLGELFQQIQILKNELELASQESVRQAEELEKEEEEIKLLNEKKQYLIQKIRAKITKKIYLEETLRIDRLEVENFRQVS